MNEKDNNLDQILNQAKIFSPGSKQMLLREKSMCRYLEKEYLAYLENPITIESTNVSTSKGELMEKTGDLMDTHYDEDIDLFMGFLDTNYRAYTMAYYGETGDDDITLEEAQKQKFELIAQRAQIKGNEKILNIGCGFGSLETYLLQEYPDLQITGVTPSAVQIKYIKTQMKDANHPLSNGFTLLEGIFDEEIHSKLGNEKFDLVTSIGVFEHLLNMEKMLELIAGILKPDGRTFHHFITSKEVTNQVKLQDKTEQYFPGGRIWPENEFSRHTQHFDVVDTWFVNGKNYWRTLDSWHQRYWESLPELYKNNFDLKALKHWNDYFLLCKAAFAPLDGTFFGNSQYLFKKKSND